MTSMAPELARITAERVQAELTKLLLGAAPRAGLELLVETGLAAVVLPELPALAMAADEHGQHKDVYAHTLQVLDQAIALEDGPGLISSCGGRPCCTTSASRTPGASRGTGGSASITTRWSAPGWRALG